MAERLTMQEVIEHCDKTTRLMERVFTCVHDGGEFGQIESKGYLEHKQTSEWLRELQKYKELEEQGRLIELPCAVGDTVYVKMAEYCDIQYAEAEVRDFTHFTSCGFCIVVTSKHFDKMNIPFSEIGKTVFLTKEEAEAKLKERGEQ